MFGFEQTAPLTNGGSLGFKLRVPLVGLPVALPVRN